MLISVVFGIVLDFTKRLYAASMFGWCVCVCIYLLKSNCLNINKADRNEMGTWRQRVRKSNEFLPKHTHTHAFVYFCIFSSLLFFIATSDSMLLFSISTACCLEYLTSTEKKNTHKQWTEANIFSWCEMELLVNRRQDSDEQKNE